MFVDEKNLKKEFVCVVCLFAEFFVSKDVHLDCEFCDLTLIFSLLAVFESVAYFVISSISEDLSSENQSSSASFFSLKREESKAEKKVVFISCSSVCFFVNSFVESLFALVFFVLESSFLISFE